MQLSLSLLISWLQVVGTGLPLAEHSVKLETVFDSIGAHVKL